MAFVFITPIIVQKVIFITIYEMSRIKTPVLCVTIIHLSLFVWSLPAITENFFKDAKNALSLHEDFIG